MAEIIVTSENFVPEVLQSEIPVLVDFGATWCGPCRMLAPIIEELAEELDGTVKVAKADIDESMDLAMKYNIQAVPTIMLFKNGEVVKQEAGFMPKEMLKEVFGL